MGQQQLLLIVLGIIIVGIAIAVGVNMFQNSARDSNRQAVVSDLMNLAAKAQCYYLISNELGGGDKDFQGFKLDRLDTANTSGSYRLATSAPSTAGAIPAPSGANVEITSSVTDSIYIIGWGKEDGDNISFKVECYTVVTPSTIATTVLH